MGAVGSRQSSAVASWRWSSGEILPRHRGAVGGGQRGEEEDVYQNNRAFPTSETLEWEVDRS